MPEILGKAMLHHWSTTNQHLDLRCKIIYRAGEYHGDMMVSIINQQYESFYQFTCNGWITFPVGIAIGSWQTQAKPLQRLERWLAKAILGAFCNRSSSLLCSSITDCCLWTFNQNFGNVTSWVLAVVTIPVPQQAAPPFLSLKFQLWGLPLQVLFDITFWSSWLMHP